MKITTIAILGGGESGVGTAILAKKKGYKIWLSDKGEIKEKYKKVLTNIDINWEENKHTNSEIFKADVVVKSPGIPDSVSVVKALQDKGIPVISEIEFASRYTDALLIGITGSNGKTTTTELVFHILKQAGLSVNMAGNIGDSFAKQVAETNPDIFVLELSSFQLDGIVEFKPHIAILTNISPDHLDRYNYKLQNYIEAKFRIVMNQDVSDYFIYDADDEHIKAWLSCNSIKPQLIGFSVQKKLEKGAWLEEDKIEMNINEAFTMVTSAMKIKGKHNTKNAMAAATVAKLLNLRKDSIRESLESFQGVEHRLEKVLKINNVQYINDSKATNVNATYYALESMEGETIWIVGGVDKGNEYEELLALVNEKVKAIICLGIDNTKIKETFGNCIDTIEETQSMKEAVSLAYKIAEKGDAVLLSPACASFDLFENYEDRGRQFKDAVRNL